MPTTPTPHELAIPCCSPGWTHYRATDNGKLTCTRSGGYTGCGHTFNATDLPAPARDGDTVTVEGGVLVYRIDPAAQFRLQFSNDWPRTFTARELEDYLRHICVWQHFTRDAAILDAARNGRHVEKVGHDRTATITRIA
ncbi:hypothetical protein AB0D90_03715 [Streptomyces althioticus]|uniref:hypothetical protein n=1 Tax=Streptomyces althioticus TaxID=83380 RepID=UPI0033F37AA5